MPGIVSAPAISFLANGQRSNFGIVDIDIDTLWSVLALDAFGPSFWGHKNRMKYMEESWKNQITVYAGFSSKLAGIFVIAHNLVATCRPQW